MSFEAAVEFVSKSTTTTNSQTKLNLYALYKIATISSIPTSSRPGIFDFTARAKYDSWKELGCQVIYAGNEGKQVAREQYLKEARSLGFSDNEVEGFEIRKEKKEMMVGVSMMETEEAPVASGKPSQLHDLAVQNKLEELKELLKQPGVEVNALDSYGYTSLHLAADRGFTEVVKALLTAGADKEILDSEGISAWELSEEAGHDDIAVILGRS